MMTATSSLASNSLDNLELPVTCGNDADKNQQLAAGTPQLISDSLMHLGRTQ